MGRPACALGIALRRGGGHIGFGVVPSERCKGYATGMLRQSLPLARALGLEHVLITCDDNVASIRTIERAGGLLEDIVPVEEAVPKRRYWIKL